MKFSRWDVCAMVLGGILAGCASLPQSVQVSSTPAGAMVSVDGAAQVETTPLTLTLDPSRSYAIRLEKSCYATELRTLEPSLGKRQIVGTVYDLVNQLPPTVHVDLTPTCAAGRTS